MAISSLQAQTIFQDSSSGLFFTTSTVQVRFTTCDMLTRLTFQAKCSHAGLLLVLLPRREFRDGW